VVAGKIRGFCLLGWQLSTGYKFISRLPKQKMEQMSGKGQLQLNMLLPSPQKRTLKPAQTNMLVEESTREAMS
jgi:hypothetical protein